MNDLITATISAVILGMVTTLHPCPLATNLAAVSVVCGWNESTWKSLASGAALVMGLAFSYAILGIAIMSMTLSAPEVVFYLNNTVRLLIGPVMILLGMVFCRMFQATPFFRIIDFGSLKKKNWNIMKSFILGLVLALVFCPISALSFFGVLLPMAMFYQSKLWIPVAFGVGAGLPLLVCIFLLIRGVIFADRMMMKRGVLVKTIPLISGVILIVTGLYFSVVEVFLN